MCTCQDSICSWSTGHCRSFCIRSLFSLNISIVLRLFSGAASLPYPSFSFQFFKFFFFIRVIAVCFTPFCMGCMAGLPGWLPMVEAPHASGTPPPLCEGPVLNSLYITYLCVFMLVYLEWFVVVFFPLYQKNLCYYKSRKQNKDHLHVHGFMSFVFGVKLLMFNPT